MTTPLSEASNIQATMSEPRDFIIGDSPFVPMLEVETLFALHSPLFLAQGSSSSMSRKPSLGLQPLALPAA